MVKNILQYDIILASASPRRSQLLNELGISFRIQPKHISEDFNEQLAPQAVAEYLSNKKAQAFTVNEINDNTLIITADTIVTIDGIILGKPKDEEEAKTILQQLSGRNHQVITGVTLKSATKSKTFSVETKVFFKKLSNSEIDYYIKTFKPFDKAGAYGIQEWIGLVCRINGIRNQKGLICYFVLSDL